MQGEAIGLRFRAQGRKYWLKAQRPKLQGKKRLWAHLTRHTAQSEKGVRARNFKDGILALAGPNDFSGFGIDCRFLAQFQDILPTV